jgi:hypothetical protein
MDFYANLPYGEGFGYAPHYGVYLISSGNAQMLWIGLEFLSGGHRITDALPFPPLRENDILVPFQCSRDSLYDIYLIAVARCGPEPLDDIVRGWRINPAHESLDVVSTRAIECYLW